MMVRIFALVLVVLLFINVVMEDEMFVCSCKEKVRYNNGRVKLYWLVDAEGVYYFVTPVELKNKR